VAHANPSDDDIRRLGISSEEAAQRASDGGLIVVMDKCIGVTVSKMGVHPGDVL
jgi:predicted CoA-binding protein